MRLTIILSVLLAAASGSALPAAEPDLDGLVSQLAAYEYGQSRAALNELDAQLRQSQGSRRFASDLERRLIKLISGQASLAGKDAACRYLSLIGTAESVPALARLLSSPETVDMARYALERIPSPSAGQALRNALLKLSGDQQIGVINSLGARRDAAALPALSRLARTTDLSVARASVAALASIATPQSCAFIDSLSPGPPALREQILDSRLRCAGLAASRGDRKGAFAAYRRLHLPENPLIIRAAALEGLAKLDARQAREPLLAALRGNEPALQASAIRALAKAEGMDGIAVLREEFPKLSPRAQAQTLSALLERADPTVIPLFAGAAKNPAIEVQIVALEGLARFGDASNVPLLAETAAAGLEPQAAAARQALAVLPSKDADAAIVAAIPSAAPKVKLELVRAAGERGAILAAPVLLKAARDADRDIRREALRALINTAGESHLGPLADLVARPASPADLREAQRTLSFVLQRLSGANLDVLAASYRSASDADARAALLTVIGQSGREEFLPLLRAELRSADPPTRRAAIGGLTQWPAPAPMPDLLETARNDSSPALRTLALRGYIRLAGLPSERPASQSASLLREALKLAAQPDEKKAILGLLSRFPCPEALAIAESAIQDATVAAEAKAAVETIRKAMSAGK